MKRLILPLMLWAMSAANAAAYDDVFDSDIFDNQTHNEEELEDDWSSEDTVGDMGLANPMTVTIGCTVAYLLYAWRKRG